MAKIISRKTHTSGIVLGGIGTGGMELYPDGEFHGWQLQHPERWLRCSWDKEVEDGEGFTGDLSFWLREKHADGTVVVRKLGQRTDSRDFTYRMFGWNRPVEEIEFEGRFPVCRLQYRDPDLRSSLRLQAAAPFVPHDYRASSMPGFYLDFSLENPTNAPMEAELLAILDPRCIRSGGRKVCLHRSGGELALELGPAGPGTEPERGSLCLGVSGDGSGSYAADYGRFLREYVGSSDYGVTQESILFAFRREGRLEDTMLPQAIDLIPDESIGALSDEELSRRVTEAGALASGRSVLERVGHLMPGYPRTRQEQEQFLQCYYKMVRKMGGEDPEAYGAGALCRALELAPGGRAEVRFTLGWFFPNHFSESGVRLGHAYENHIDSAYGAVRFLTDHPEICRGARELADLLYDTDLPAMYPESWSAQLSTLVKSSWWTRDGRFGLWEGLGYCGFHTTDITYHASFGLAALFPRLQQRQMAMTAQHQREDGRVPHCFVPDFDHVDDGFDRVDMNLQFVLLTGRDYLVTGDREALQTLWPHVCRALEDSRLLDGDGDGLPDRDTCRNTYDSWNFSGTPAYIAVLWLAALRVGCLLAQRMGAAEEEARWSALLEQGRASLETRLWNGEYYDLWRDGEAADGALMTDQLDGEWFLRMLGLPGNLPDARVREVLERIMAANFDPQAGLLNATTPAGHSTTLATYRNCQAGACWTGIAYLTAALAAAVELRPVADTLVRTVETVQGSLGMLWDHWECGCRYTRPLSSFSTLLALSGLTQDGERGLLRLRPRFRGRMPVFPGRCGAILTAEDGCLRLEARTGELCLKELELPSAVCGQVTVDGAPAEYTAHVRPEGTTLVFSSGIRAKTLEISDYQLK